MGKRSASVHLKQGGGAMSEAVMERVRELIRNVERNTPIVEERIAQAGLSAEPLLVFSMAKYWDTLEKLASE